MFAVWNFGVYAPNGCYYSLCRIQVWIYCSSVSSLFFSWKHKFTSCLLINVCSPCNFCSESGVVKKRYPRISEKMPPVPVETKYHPSVVDSLFIMQRLIGQSQTSNQNLLQFLLHEFVKINKTQALQLIGIKEISLHNTHLYYKFSLWYFTGEMGPGVTSETLANSLTFPQIARMHELFQQGQFDDPSGNVWCLAIL